MLDALGPADAVVLVAHGTVSDLDDLPQFLTRVRQGRPPSAELVGELRRRYEAIGGSPLLDVTHRQASALARILNAPVLVGMRLWEPGLERVLRSVVPLGTRRLVVLPLAPFSVHVYAAAAEKSLLTVQEELGSRAPKLVHVAPFGTLPSFVEAHAARIRALFARTGTDADAALVFTAHSLPSAVIGAGDPYAAQVEASAAAIGARLGASFELAYQSQGAQAGAWLGPDLRSVLELVRARGQKRVVVAPIGFLSEHVETLYDLDVEARAWAESLELEMLRVPALDDDPALAAALAEVVLDALKRASNGERG
jgi:ferrochelatase